MLPVSRWSEGTDIGKNAVFGGPPALKDAVLNDYATFEGELTPCKDAEGISTPFILENESPTFLRTLGPFGETEVCN